MALNIETKRINAMQALTGIANDDSIIVELAGGGTKRMTYATLLQILRDAIVGGDSRVLTADDIVQVMVNNETVIPSCKLLYDNIRLQYVPFREQRCINEGIDGIEWDLDDLMTLVRNGEFTKFAIGDSFVDGGVTWRIFAKNHYPKWAFDGVSTGGITTGNVPPNHIVCLPDTSLGKYQFNTSDTNAGGYAGSLMPANMVTEYNKLSTKLKGYVKETQIYENNKSAWATVKRYMRLPTVIEMTGSQGWADQYSGGVCSQFPLAQATKHRIRYYWYWLLDPVASDPRLFCAVTGSGQSGDASASVSGAVRPEIVLA